MSDHMIVICNGNGGMCKPRVLFSATKWYDMRCGSCSELYLASAVDILRRSAEKAMDVCAEGRVIPVCSGWDYGRRGAGIKLFSQS